MDEYTNRRVPEPVDVAVAVIQRDEKYLLSQRKPGSFRAFYWEFPGGKREEKDSDLEDCLRREIKEELGVDLSIRRQLTPVAYSYKEQARSMVLHAFLCDIADDSEPTGLEGNRIGWFYLNEIPALRLVEADRVIYSELLRVCAAA